MTSRIRVGLSGWDYPTWRGEVYPPTLPRSDQLAYVARRFDTVEVNATFYSLVNPTTFERWYRAVPRGFVFAVKGSRYITHVKKLAGIDAALANFFASGVLELGNKLGPLVWQLPGHLRLLPSRIDEFLALLPRNTGEAADLARRHDDRIERPRYGPGGVRRVRHVLEVRHPDHLCDEVAAIARRHRVALAVSDAAAWSRTEEITSGFVYVRLHGPHDLYTSGYDDGALSWWSARVRRWNGGGEPDDAARLTDRNPPPRIGRDVYVYFNNTAGGHAMRDATVLRDLIRR